MFEITAEPIKDTVQKQVLSNAQAGALVVFEGWVRQQNEGKQVHALEYEAYEPLANSEGEKILQEAKEQFDVLAVMCTHRVGQLEIEEMAVWVGVTAVHRDAAFKACEYIINEVKARVPIWKKEFYESGDSGWVNCQRCSHPHSHSQERPILEPEKEHTLYLRQLALPEIGLEGQEKLKNSNVLVVGAGGLGSAALLYLATAGVGTLGICENDCLEASNLNRQILYTYSEVGSSKAQLAVERIQTMNPFIQVHCHPHLLNAHNVAELFQDYDVILDCTDNFEAKYLINDAAVRYQKQLIQASIYQYEGQLLRYDPQTKGPCFRCLWPEPPEVSGTCEDGILGAVAGILGTMQALETLKLLLNLSQTLPADRILLVNLLDYKTTTLKRTHNKACTACDDTLAFSLRTVHQHQQKTSFEIDPYVISPEELAEYCWVDIRESLDNWEPLFPLMRSSLKIPASKLDTQKAIFQASQKYLLCCQKGMSSRYWANKLRYEGQNNIYSLKNGIQAFNARTKHVHT